MSEKYRHQQNLKYWVNEWVSECMQYMAMIKDVDDHDDDFDVFFYIN